ncbi:ESCRT-III subunit protein snf7 [Claviceps purpurea]|uniref:Vacuolar-sorting protein SNF7 n=5 Tax=Claviceps TaxID=5110 RepID=M1WEY3_CLAP2|nr:ESCRT-III subunit protein snf7 [Claviceps capensis]KAG5948634.1 ESCRT-III subunit protein snf7 [Claviceps pazoutovae]KAG5956871.1 ESCRT-III subunit protein snf7 [Claviceps arundinis]KAG6023536.1 ESCRT-III subunit protein snf7 [Claviceps sp. LM458 group G5]KAG6037794.1 ESCRT-III subunit protein snf7 [Claviceps sp. Clav32 group G5]KAG6050070.1 ESCRT-III subunit protein snf7 [Claviceps sp. Clav50 group G5]KAG6054279.1 ESCRT-III subunit protein snf7 [Claviceps sp. LM77 group G4]KAG6064606.1 E
MWSWFGGGAAAQARKDSPKNAILSLRTQLDMLQKRERHLQSQIDEQLDIARKNATSNKNAAKAALRRKKANEHTQEQTLAQIQTLETQINSIESANINHETLLAMQQAGKAMKHIHGKLTPEKVDQTMDELREQNALSDEIVNAITNNPIGDPLDEDELEAELDELQQEKLDEDILKTGNVPVADLGQRMPSVASQEPVSVKAPVEQEDDEEAELRRLQAEMAM